MLGSAERISETRRRKNPESSTTRTLTTINTPLGTAAADLSPAAGPESNTPCGVTLEHARHVENQGNATVTGNGGARHARGPLQHLAQRFDDHFFLADQLIDDKADPLGAHRKDHHMAFTLLFVSSRADQPALEVEQRQGLVPDNHHSLTVDHVGA